MANGAHLDQSDSNNSLASARSLIGGTWRSLPVETAAEAHPVIEPAIAPAIQSASAPASHSSSQPLEQPPIRPFSQPSGDPTHLPQEKAIYLPLTLAQGKVLLYLLEKVSGATNVGIISTSTGIPLGTVKDALRALCKAGYIVEKWRIVQHAFRGFGYSLNHKKSTEYAALVRGATQQSNHPSSQQRSQDDVQPSPHPVIMPSRTLSSSCNPRTTTRTNVRINLDHPELDFWVEKGLEPKVVAGWMEEFGISAEVILQSLKHAAFDIPIQEMKRGEQIDAFNWFYKGVQRFGNYRRPPGYKPLEQILLDEAQKEREELEKLAQALADERERHERASQELKFQQIMSNPTGREYHQLKAIVDSRGGPTLSGKMLESAFREAFLSQPSG